jgi:glutamate-ammonia-ligase adenylyltransferase
MQSRLNGLHAVTSLPPSNGNPSEAGIGAHIGASLVGPPRPVPPLDAMREAIAAALARSGLGDARDGESRAVAILSVRRREELRIREAVLAGRLDARGSARALSQLADACVEATKHEALRDLSPRLDRRHAERLGLLALGSLGSRELNFGSDLDLVFVLDDAPSLAADYARFVQRWVGLLDPPRRQERLYGVDLRLRPDGGQGAVVPTLSGLRDYYAERATPMERLALLRSRPIATAARLARRLDDLVGEVIGMTDVAAAADAAQGIRRKWREARAATQCLEIKSMPGGRADLEMAVQLLQLEAIQQGRWPGRMRVSTPDAIDRLGVAGTLDRRLVRGAATAWSRLRDLESRHRLSSGTGETALPSTRVERGFVTGAVSGIAPQGARLDSEIAETVGVVQELLVRAGLPAI